MNGVLIINIIGISAKSIDEISYADLPKNLFDTMKSADIFIVFDNKHFKILKHRWLIDKQPVMEIEYLMRYVEPYFNVFVQRKKEITEWKK